MLGLIVSIVIVGLIAGAVARLLIPGKQDIGILMTIVLGIVDPRTPATEAALALADRIEQLAVRVGVPRGLAQLGVSDDDLPRLAAAALQDACMTTNPRQADAAQIQALFRAAM